MNQNVRQPIVSVVMPAYNCELYIETAIRSVMQQTYQNWELLVIDDASTDSTFEIVERMMDLDPRIQGIKNPTNMGAAKTRNRGLDMAKGEYVAFLDSDDCWYADKLTVQLRCVEQAGADLSYTSYAIVDGNGLPSRPIYRVPASLSFGELLKENVIGCSTVLISRKIVQNYRFATDFYHEDYCLWLNILQDGYSAVGCPEVLVDWRLIETSRSFNKKRSAKNRWRIYRKHLKLSVFRSAGLFATYACRGIKKYYGKRRF